MAMAMAMAAGSVEVKVDFDEALYVPGQKILADVRVSPLSRELEPASMSSRCDGDGSGGNREGTSRKEISFRFVCVERIERSLVDIQTGDGVEPYNNRRVQRLIGTSNIETLPLEESDGSDFKFHVSIALPADIPPTFAGAAISYVYFLETQIHWAGSGMESVELLRKKAALASVSTPVRVWVTPWAEGSEPWKVQSNRVFFELEAEHSEASCIAGSHAPPGEELGEGQRGSCPLSVRTTPGGGLRGRMEEGSPSGNTMPDGSIKRRSRANSISSTGSGGPEFLFGDALQTYNIHCNDTAIVRLHVLGLQGRHAHPGSLLECVLDFLPTGGELVCSEVSLMLCSEEKVVRPKLAHQNRFTKLWHQSTEITLHTSKTSFTFNVPSESYPTFETDSVGLEWALVFDFKLCKPSPKGLYPSGKMNWSLPVIMSFS